MTSLSDAFLASELTDLLCKGADIIRDVECRSVILNHYKAIKMETKFRMIEDIKR